jgi:hypothetical protein
VSDVDVVNRGGSRRALGCLTVLLVVAALVGGLVYVHHIRGARYVATATRIGALTVDQCVAAFDQFGISASASDACRGHESDLWFSVRVENVGHRDAFLLTCVVDAISSVGAVLYGGEVNVPPVGFPANPGKHLGPGETVEYRWYLSARPASTTIRVDHYTAACEPIDYNGKFPV